jgi:hypothetical protein
MSILPESPWFSWVYRAESGEPGGPPTAKGADQPVYGLIHGVGGIASILLCHFFCPINLLHLSRE